MIDRGRAVSAGLLLLGLLASCSSPDANDRSLLELGDEVFEVAPITSRTPPTDWPGADVASLASRTFLDDAQLLESLEVEELCLDGHTSYVGGVALAPAGDLVVTGSGDMTVALWRVARAGGAPTMLAIGRGHRSRVDALAWHPTAPIVVSGSMDGTLRVWRVEVVDPVARLAPLACVELEPGNEPQAIAFTPGGELLVAEDLGRLGAWSLDPRTGELAFARAFTKDVGATPAGTAIDVSPDGRRAIVGQARGSADLWALDGEPRLLGSVELGLQVWVRTVAFSADGRRVALGGGDQDHGVAAVHDVSGDACAPIARITHEHVLGNNGGPRPIVVVRVGFLGDDLITIAGESIKRWRGDHPPVVVTTWRTTGRDTLLSADVSADGRWIVAGSLGAPRPFRVEEEAIEPGGPPVDEGQSSTDDASVALAQGDVLRAPGRVARTRLVVTSLGMAATPLEPFPSDPVWVGAVASSRDGRLVVTAAVADGPARLWRYGPAPRAIAELGRRVISASFSPDRRWLLTLARDGALASWRIADDDTPELTARRPGREDAWQERVSVAADGLFLASGGELVLGRVEDDGELSTLARWKGGGSADLSPDGRFVLSTDEVWTLPGTVPPARSPGARLWRIDGDTDERITPRLMALLGPAETRAVAFSPDGAFAATAHTDARVRLWRLDPRGGAPWLASTLRCGEKLADGPGALAFSADGALLVGGARPARVWRVLGRFVARIGDAEVLWERSAVVPAGTPRLRVRAARVNGDLEVQVTNEGDAAAHEVIGSVHVEHARAPLGDVLRVAIGAVLPGRTVVRRLALPSVPYLVVREVTWTDRWGRAPAPTPVDAQASSEPLSERRRALRDAGRLALELSREHVWTSRLHDQIAAALVRDGDLEAALQVSAAEPGPSGFGNVHRSVALARARAGDAAGARAAVRLETDASSAASIARAVEVELTLARVDHEPSMEQAQEVCQAIASPALRSGALARLAARARRERRADLAGRTLEAAIDAATEVGGEDARFFALRRLTRAAGDDPQARRRVLVRLEDAVTTSFQDVARAQDLARVVAAGWARVGERDRAMQLFEQVVEAALAGGDMRQAQMTVRALHRVGLLEHARATIGPLRSHAAWYEHADLDRATLEGVLAQLERGDLDSAAALASSIDQFRQFGDDGLTAVTIALAQAGRVEDALALGPRFQSQSLRAAAVLEAARVQAERGDLASARATAASAMILRSGWSSFPGVVPQEQLPFEPLEPSCWIVNYDHTSFGTMSSWSYQVACSRRLAHAAMRLHVQLGLADADAYLRAFGGRAPADTLRALAAGQASEGDVRGARAWADRLRDREERAHALLGIGEALLPPAPIDEDHWEAWD